MKEGVKYEWHFLKRKQLNYIEKRGWSDDKLIATKQIAITGGQPSWILNVKPRIFNAE